MKRTLLTALRLPIVLTAAGEQNPGPPTEFQLFANGDTPTLKGTFKCSEFACTRILSAMAAAGRDKLPIDYNHGQVSFMGASYDAGRAAGWFVPASRDGALWATNVEWTPQGAKALADKEYRLFSPAFLTDENRNVVELINVALTNLPATLHQTPLVMGEYAGTEENDMDPELKALLERLGVTSVAALSAKVGGLETQTSQLVAATQTLNTENATLKAAQAAQAEATAKAAKDALISELSVAGKLPPSLHVWAQTQSVDQLRAYGAGAVAQVTTTPVVASSTAGGTRPRVSGLTPEEIAICSQMSVSAKDFLAEKQEIAQLSVLCQLGTDKNLNINTVCVPDRLDSGFDPEKAAA